MLLPAAQQCEVERGAACRVDPHQLQSGEQPVSASGVHCAIEGADVLRSTVPCPGCWTLRATIRGLLPRDGLPNFEPALQMVRRDPGG